MADNVIRHDIVQIDFLSNLKELTKINKDVDNIKKGFSGGIGDDALTKLTKNANNSDDALNKVKNTANKVSNNVTEIGKKAATTAFKGLKKLAGISFKALSVGIGAASTAIVGLVGKSVQAYASYEQLVGGVDTLFKSSSKEVQKYANNAYKTAGLSANDYMETATSFSASLLQSLNGDTAKAAKYADMAISDMSDNANKMGTDMGSIQVAYQGFAKQNYTMLDNLKLGYGGTKTEMQRLIKDAAKIDKSVDANSTSYGNIVKAIHAVQKKTGIYGTTQKEAEKTISGSLASMKSAWGNLLPSLIQGGDSFDQCVENLVSTVGIFAGNVKPAILKALSGLGKLIDELAPMIEEEFPKIVDELLPPLIKAAMALLKGLMKALPSILKTVAKEIPTIFKIIGEGFSEAFGDKFSFLSKIGDFCSKNGDKILKFTPILIGFVGAIKLLSKVKSIGSGISGLFGKASGGAGGKSSGGIMNIFTQLAKAKPTTILKGMANLAIIIGGFTIIAAAFALVAPYIAKFSDVKSILKLLGIITALGLVGTGLTVLAGIVGKIPVSTVALGLANIAIIIAGMSALFLLIGAVSLINFDLKKITCIVGIIALLGTVGSVLTVFAGIVGMIPIPVVLAGLANIALVIGGMTALLVAYAELSKIPNFTEFLKTGGDTLALLFEQIGKIGGSLIGGLGEGIADSLPEIGEKLSAFATSIKPMFVMFKGVDMTGLGGFFDSFGGFMLKMAGNDLASIFTGGTDLEGLGTQLSNFATNSKTFFTSVSTYPEKGFSNAKLLFQSLADIGNVPNTGGVAQWFTGNNDFEALATGLYQLSSTKVSGFYTAVSKISEAGFNNAKLLFQSLADIGNIPNTGGVGQWFSGENDFEGLSENLPSFGKAMAEFYSNISSITDFTKITQLFEALKGIGKAFPNKGGVGQFFAGENDISGLGEQLKDFGTDTKEFFAQVNNLDVTKLNQLWNSLQAAGKITTDSISKMVDENISNIVKKITELPKKMGDGIRNSGQSLSDSLLEVWKNAVKASVSPVNKLLSGANWILKEFGSKNRVSTWKPYAKGTDGHKGGNALVNDGRGAELVQMPNGQSFIPKGKNVLMPNAPKGMKVLPADQTAQLMGKKSPTYRYAKGTGNIDIWNYVDNAAGLISKVKDKFVDYKGTSGFTYNTGKAMVSTISGQMTSWAKKLYDEYGAMDISSYVASKGVSQWKSTVIRALKMEGLYSASNVARTLFQMQTESGGNPRAINLWDSNAKAGIPSKGLMQVIDPTFKAYARSGYNRNIYDPLSNILASVRYAVSRYGSLAKAYQGHGYANGGIATKPSVFGESGAEMAIPLSSDKRNRALNLWEKTGSLLGVNYTPENSVGTSKTGSTEYNTYSPQFNLTISGADDERALARKVKKWIKESLDETFDSYERINPKLREV